MRTLREWWQLVRDRQSSGGGQPEHWPWDVFGGEEWREFDRRGKCLHCEDIYDALPCRKTLGDLVWDEVEEQWVCGTPGCDGSLIDFTMESDLVEVS